MIEIRARDASGRVTELNINGKKLTTPYLFPVIDPRKQILSIEEIEKLGFNGIITNSYIINQNRELRSRALEEGIHSLLGFDGVIMTDSGSFQLYQYGGVDVTPMEILEFQENIGVDIGVILDIPTEPDVPREQAEKELEETIRRARESIKARKKILLSGTVQGSTYLELREKSARKMAELGFDLYPIGGVVPLMEKYRFSDLVKIIIHSRKYLPHDKPVHLFGAGHPMLFALASALGCDLFDSAAYALYAREGRYITPSGTYRLERLRELPCSCTVCTSTTAEELKKLEKKDRDHFLAMHNLTVSIEEIRRVRQSIHDGSLWELVAERARAHPYLLEAVRVALSYSSLENLEPVTKKSAFFYTGSEALLRPEVRRHIKKLKRLKINKKLVLLPEVEKPYSKTYGMMSTEEYHICIASKVFGVIPLEIEEVYPLTQHEAPDGYDEVQINFMKKVVKEYASGFEKVYFHSSLEFLGIEGESFSDVENFKGKNDIEGKLTAIGDYYFGEGAGELLFSETRARISKTGRIREVYAGDRLVGVIRASDGSVVLNVEGVKRLLKLPFPKNRVVAHEDAVEFVSQGRSLFCGFVEEADMKIKPYQEVIVVDSQDKPIATGRAMVSAEEMLSLTHGVAVRVRHRLG